MNQSGLLSAVADGRLVQLENLRDFAEATELGDTDEIFDALEIHERLTADCNCPDFNIPPSAERGQLSASNIAVTRQSWTPIWRPRLRQFFLAARFACSYHFATRANN